VILVETLLFCFANSKQPGRQLQNLMDEYTELSTLMNPGRRNRLYDPILLPFATVDQTIENLRTLSDSICLFHFSGHANETVLELRDGSASSKGLASFLADCPELKLVFLNGCSTKEHVNQLRDAGVKAAIIATSAPVNDNRATKFSIWFYKALTEKHDSEVRTLSLKEAWAVAEDYAAVPFPEISINRGAFRIEDPIDSNKWLISYKSDDEETLNWKLPAGLARSEALKFLRASNAHLVVDFFERPNCQNQLREILQAGSVLISGPAYSGKTTLLKKEVDRLVTNLIETAETTGRPILYLDLKQAPLLDLTDIRNWFTRYNGRAAQVTPPEATLPLFPKIEPRNSAMASDDQLLTDWVRRLDEYKVTVVIDNISDSQWTMLHTLRTKSQQLLHDSNIVFVKSSQIQEGPDLSIPYLTEVETEEFAQQHPPLNDIHNLFSQTGGNLLYLSCLSQPTSAELRNTSGQTGQPLNSIFPHQAIGQLFTSAYRYIKRLYTENDIQNAVTSGLFALAMLPNGLNEALCHYYLTDWSSLQKLIGTGLLTFSQRYGETWIVMPSFTREHLPDQYQSAIKISAKQFVNQFQQKAQQSIGEEVRRIIAIKGGHQFLLDLVMILAQGIQDGNENYLLLLLRPMLIEAHKPLFEQGRWDDAYQLWNAGIGLLSPKQFEATHLILYARAAFHSGRHRQTAALLPQIQAAAPTLINQIDYLNLRASYLKEQGDRRQEDEIDQCYTDALTHLSEAAEQTESPTDPAALEDRRASLHFHRAIFRWWWQRNRETALDDLAKARNGYTTLCDEFMLNMILMEEADMRIDIATTPDLQETIETQLLTARRYFNKAGLAGDLALCQYRLGRLHKRQPNPDPAIHQQSLRDAAGYYERAAEGPDRRLQLIAQKHQLVIQGILLKTLVWDVAAPKLIKVAEELTEFQQEGDAWAARVLRDLWWFMAQPSEGKTQLDYLEKALSIAITPPLNPVSGTDEGRAVAIFWDIYQYHKQQQQRPALEDFLGGSVYDWVRRWFKKEVLSQSSFTSELISDITSKTNKPDKYYG
jgi:hypothetical protein